MLNGMPALIDLKLWGNIVDRWQHQGFIKLPQLRSLSMHIDDSNNMISAMLVALVAPILESVMFDGAGGEDFIDAGGSPMLQYPSVRGFTVQPWLGRRTMELSTWITFMTAFPGITHLHAYGVEINTMLHALRDNFFDFTPAKVVPRWPYLHTIAINHHITYLKDDLLLAVISLRIRLGRPIQRLRFTKNIMSQLNHVENQLRKQVEVEVFAPDPIDQYGINPCWKDLGRTECHLDRDFGLY
jgi:hypothetical protein